VFRLLFQSWCKSRSPSDRGSAWKLPAAETLRTADRPQCWMTHDSLYLFRLNCFWGAIVQDLCHSGGDCFIWPQAQVCGASSHEGQPQPRQEPSPAISPMPAKPSCSRERLLSSPPRSRAESGADSKPGSARFVGLRVAIQKAFEDIQQAPPGELGALIVSSLDWLSHCCPF
jgi:hypothetical protein